jgi:hypothetical protein
MQRNEDIGSKHFVETWIVATTALSQAQRYVALDQEYKHNIRKDIMPVTLES